MSSELLILGFGSPATETAYLRVDVDDLRRITKTAEKTGILPPEVMRQAIHFCAGKHGKAMILNPIKIVNQVVAAARLNAALRRTNQYRHIAGELRRTAEEYDRKADEVSEACNDRGVRS